MSWDVPGKNGRAGKRISDDHDHIYRVPQEIIRPPHDYELGYSQVFDYGIVIFYPLPMFNVQVKAGCMGCPMHGQEFPFTEHIS